MLKDYEFDDDDYKPDELQNDDGVVMSRKRPWSGLRLKSRPLDAGSHHSPLLCGNCGPIEKHADLKFKDCINQKHVKMLAYPLF